MIGSGGARGIGPGRDGRGGGRDPGREHPRGSDEIDVRPMRSLWLLVFAHAVNHAYAVLLPLIFLEIIDEFHRARDRSPTWPRSGRSSGLVQLSSAVADPEVLAGGPARDRRPPLRWRVRGPGAGPSFGTFAIPNVLSRIGAAPQHPVGNGLLAEQFPPERRASRSAPTSPGATSGPSSSSSSGRRWPRTAGGGPRSCSASRRSSSPSLILLLCASMARTGHRRSPTAASARRSARSSPTATSAGSTSPRSSAAAAAAWRGEPLRPDLPDQGDRARRPDLGPHVRRAHRVLGADAARRRLAVGPDRPEAAHRRGLRRRGDRLRRIPPAGSSLVGLWIGIAVMGLFSFAESPQLQALLADIAPASSATRRSPCTSRWRSESARCGSPCTG